MTALLHGDDQHEPLEGKVDLVYIDPPFAVQSDFRFNIEITNGATDEKLPTLIEELAYTDTWKDGLDSYLSMMRDRLELMKSLLTPTGSIYIHCDWHAGHYIKVLMDEVFGYENFKNEIAWKRSLPHNDPRKYGAIHDVILYYTKSSDYTFNQQFAEQSDEYKKSHYTKSDPDGRVYRLQSLSASGPGPARRFGDRIIAPPVGTHWRYSQEKIDDLLAKGLIVFTSTGQPNFKRYLDESRGSALQSLWTDVNPLNPQALERMDFPTQKPVALLNRIIAASTNPGDLVLDAFAGSGTTAVAAETMKDADGKPTPRRWIAIDCGKFAIHITRKRLIEVGAQPFAVENVGFYARGREWRDLWAERPEAKVYRDAMVEIYGGTPVGGYAHLHGQKQGRWVHVGPIDAPIAASQVDAVLTEAGATEMKAVDILSADIPIDFNKGEAEERYGVQLFNKIIPEAAVEAVRSRVKRRQRKDAALEEGPGVHFFSPPDVEVGISVAGDSVTVKLLRLTVDLEDCLGTQDPAKRAQIKARITDWRALVDYWAVDWDYREGEPFQNDWQSFRTLKSKEIVMQAANSYGNARGEKLVAVKVTDIFGNDGLKVARVTIT